VRQILGDTLRPAWPQVPKVNRSQLSMTTYILIASNTLQKNRASGNEATLSPATVRCAIERHGVRYRGGVVRRASREPTSGSGWATGSRALRAKRKSGRVCCRVRRTPGGRWPETGIWDAINSGGRMTRPPQTDFSASTFCFYFATQAQRLRRSAASPDYGGVPPGGSRPRRSPATDPGDRVGHPCKNH